MVGDLHASGASVLDHVGDVLAAGEAAVLATVVAVEGNAYRRPGAKMLVTPEGGVGSLTAGCLEDEVGRIAQQVLDGGERRVETYDLMDDDVWGMGVGCDGVVDVLLEPLDDSYGPVVEAHRAGESLAVLTVLSGDGADARAYYRSGEGVTGTGDTTETALPDWLADAVADPAAELLAQDSSDMVRIETADGDATVFVDAVTPPPELVVLGSGHDVGPVVELGKRNGFRVTVVGFRGATDLEERFPAADRTVSTSPANLRGVHEFDGRTCAVVMTHNFVDDRLAVDELLRTDAQYVGLMGPRERFEEMLEAFDAEGREFEAADLDRVYTPVGLDLGNGSPYGIATSTVAEALAVHNGREPDHLRTREGPIHDRAEVEGSDEAVDERPAPED